MAPIVTPSGGALSLISLSTMSASIRILQINPNTQKGIFVEGRDLLSHLFCGDSFPFVHSNPPLKNGGIKGWCYSL